MTLLTAILKKPLIQMFIVGCIACLVIFVAYADIPKYMTFDEIEFAKLALQLDGKAYTPYSTYATGHATFYFYILLISFKLLGISKFALRIPAAIFGVLNPLVFYLLLRKIFAHKKFHLSPKILSLTPLLLSLLFITSRWYINFSRFGFEVTFLLLLELVSLFFIIFYLEKKRVWQILASGLFAGLAYNSYQPGRLFFFIPLLLLVLHYITISPRPTKLHFFREILLFLMPFVLIISPLTVYLIQHPDIRMYQLFYPDNHEMTLIGKLGYFAEDVWKTFAMFFFQGDMNGRHNYTGKPALNPVMSIFFIVGLINAIKNRKNIINVVFLSWLLLSLIPTLLTYPWENPNMLRTFTVIPPLVYLCGLTITWTFEKIQKLKQLYLQKIGMVLLSLLIVFSIFYELRTYFYYQRVVFYESFEAKKELLYYINHPDTSVFEK